MSAVSALVGLVVAIGGNQAPSLESSLDRVPNRKKEWSEFLKSLPKEERKGGEYLLTYMPLADLKGLPIANVREALDLSLEARKRVSWVRSIPQDVFFDAVLPYANVTEPRRSMRTEFQKRYLPEVENTKSPGEAAMLVNRALFKDYKVTYNTHRLRTDQSPPESIAQGMATCTGLSIMLVDALRAVGVPARMLKFGIKADGISWAPPNRTMPGSITRGLPTKLDVRLRQNRRTQSGQ